MTIFMFIAGISFSLIYRVSKGDFKSLIKTTWHAGISSLP